MSTAPPKKKMSLAQDDGSNPLLAGGGTASTSYGAAGTGAISREPDSSAPLTAKPELDPEDKDSKKCSCRWNYLDTLTKEFVRCLNRNSRIYDQFVFGCTSLLLLSGIC